MPLSIYSSKFFRDKKISFNSFWRFTIWRIIMICVVFRIPWPKTFYNWCQRSQCKSSDFCQCPNLFIGKSRIFIMSFMNFKIVRKYQFMSCNSSHIVGVFFPPSNNFWSVSPVRDSTVNYRYNIRKYRKTIYIQ